MGSLSIPAGEGGCRSDEGREVKEAVGRLIPRTARRIQDREWVGVPERATRYSRDRTEPRDAPRPHDLFILQMLYKILVRLCRQLRPVRESLPAPFGTSVLYRDSSDFLVP